MSLQKMAEIFQRKKKTDAKCFCLLAKLFDALHLQEPIFAKIAFSIRSHKYNVSRGGQVTSSLR